MCFKYPLGGAKTVKMLHACLFYTVRFLISLAESKCIRNTNVCRKLCDRSHMTDHIQSETWQQLLVMD